IRRGPGLSPFGGGGAWVDRSRRQRWRLKHLRELAGLAWRWSCLRRGRRWLGTACANVALRWGAHSLKETAEVSGLGWGRSSFGLWPGLHGGGRGPGVEQLGE